MSARYLIVILTVVFGLLTLNVAIAKKQIRFPVGCTNVGHKFDLYNVILTPTSRRLPQTVYFIHNISKESIYLHQEKQKDKLYTTRINGNISANQWSVLAVAEKQMKFACTTLDRRKKNHELISCEKVLDICEFRQSNFGINHRGTYWLLLNKSRKTAMKMTRDYGVWLNARHEKKELE